jgi:hypothetical protein
LALKHASKDQLHGDAATFGTYEASQSTAAPAALATMVANKTSADLMVGFGTKEIEARVAKPFADFDDSSQVQQPVRSRTCFATHTLRPLQSRIFGSITQ